MNEIRVGILHSLSGTMAASESCLVNAAVMAIEEINRDGGVLGKPARAIVEDGCSTAEVFRSKAEKLLQQERVATLFGCWTSASRKAVKPVVERHDSLLWYPVQYEGLEQSRNIVYTGSCVNQQIEPGVRWCLAQGKRRFFLVGSDYVFPRTANRLIRGLVEAHGGTILGEEYRPLGSTSFSSAVQSAVACRPDFIFNTINGDGNTAFFKDYAASGVEFPVMSFSLSELELRTIAELAVGHYACWSYFQSLDTPENRRFVERFKNRWGQDQVSSDPVVMAYAQVHLWRQAVLAAGSLDIHAILAGLDGQKFLSPAGEIEIQANNHVKKPVLIGKTRRDGQFDIAWQADELLAPRPWLGIENTDLEAEGLIKEALGQYTEVVHLTSLLQEEIAKRRAAEAELTTHREHLEELVKERTHELVCRTEQLQQANARLRESNRLKSEFLSTMSHELRTPLNSVLALSQLMISHSADTIPKDDVECLNVIERNGRRLLDLINDVLDLSRIASGDVEIHDSDFNPHATLDAALQTTRPAADDKGVEIHVDLSDLDNLGDPPVIHSDEEKVRQILLNLLSNAVKFTDQGRIDVATTISEETISFVVQDTGVGIADADLPYIFDEFRQADGSSTRQYEGTGLGLAICQKLATVLGGRISIESELGRGSVFTFTIPVRYCQPAPSHEPIKCIPSRP